MSVRIFVDDHPWDMQTPVTGAQMKVIAGRDIQYLLHRWNDSDRVPVWFTDSDTITPTEGDRFYTCPHGEPQ